MLLWMALVWEAIETPSLTVTMYLPGMGSLAEAIAMRDWEEDMREQWVGGIDLESSTAFIVRVLLLLFTIHSISIANSMRLFDKTSGIL